MMHYFSAADSVCDVLKRFPAPVLLRAGSWKGMERDAMLHTVHSVAAHVHIV